MASVTTHDAKVIADGAAASGLPRSTPEAQGIASAALWEFVAAANERIHDLHSLMLLRHGRVVAEGWWAPYAPPYPHMLFSLSKSFTSTAAGLAAAEGRLRLDDPVLGFFPEKAPAVVSGNLAAMRVRDLLTMTTGHAEDTTGRLRERPDGDWAAAFLELPVEYAPGTHFLYNSGATYMVSAIVQRVTGQRVLDYLRPRLFEPLGITEPTWQTCPHGVDTGGWGLSVKTEDIARFGQLYLQDGVWNGERLLPAGWVEEASAAQVPNGSNPDSDWNQGYGYQFWRCRHGAYRGDGAFGQFCLVMPEQDAVLALTAGTGDLQGVLNVVWEHLLPALASNAPLPDDPAAHTALRQRLASLSLPTPTGKTASPRMASVSGATYRFVDNPGSMESIALTFGDDGACVLHLRDGVREQTLTCAGRGVWSLPGAAITFDSRDGAPTPATASGAWTSDDTYTMRLAFYETPFCPTVTLHFDENGDRLTLDYRRNVAFGSLEGPHLVGRRNR